MLNTASGSAGPTHLVRGPDTEGASAEGDTPAARPARLLYRRVRPPGHRIAGRPLSSGPARRTLAVQPAPGRSLRWVAIRRFVRSGGWSATLWPGRWARSVTPIGRS